MNSSPPRPASSSQDLGHAIERADDARDIAKDLLRRLPNYDGSETEDTARHEMHVHVHQHSQPDTEPPQIELGPVKVRGLPKWLVVALGAVVAAATAVAAHFARK